MKTLFFISECGGIPTDPSMERICNQVMSDSDLKSARFRCRAGEELNDPEKILMEINSLHKKDEWNIVFIRQDTVQLIDEPKVLKYLLDLFVECCDPDEPVPRTFPDTITCITNMLKLLDIAFGETKPMEG
jgi:hypothetical protein